MHRVSPLKKGMASVTKKIANNSVGEIGVLKHEEVQRLLSIVQEMAMLALQSLCELTSKHPKEKFDRLYAIGLASIKTWNSEIIQEEVNKMESLYPESSDLFVFTYLSLYTILQPDAANCKIPRFEDFFARFMKRVCESIDVQKGKHFLDQPLLQRRVVFIECFRNALHDILRCNAILTVTIPTKTANAKSESSIAEEGASTKSDVKNNALTNSNLNELQTALNKQSIEMQEDDEAPEKKNCPEIPKSTSKQIDLKNEPCFFEASEQNQEIANQSHAGS